VYDDITGVDPASDWIGNGSEVPNNGTVITHTVRFPSPGWYAYDITCTLDNGAEVTDKVNIGVYYIRRELRALHNNDRNQFVQAFLTMYNTPTEEGIKLYGKHYKSLAHFQAMHLRAAGGIHVDHIHDGMGVLTQHAAMTSEFELAMQSVNPRLSVPFWDFTLDWAILHARNLTSAHEAYHIFTDSVLFSEGMFGRTDTKRHTVTEGRMAQVMLKVDYNLTIRSPYGYMRAPWNLNPSHHVTRYHAMCGENVADTTTTQSIAHGDVDLAWPNCQMHWEMIYGKKFHTWYEWAWQISYAPHGAVHSWIGGVGGECEDKWDTLLDNGVLDHTQLFEMKHSAFKYLKDAYRFKVAQFPTFCTTDATEECRWKAEKPDNWTSFFDRFDDGTMGNLTDEQIHLVGKKVLAETTYWPGDQLEASSPIEMSFWPIHPTIERLFQYKDIAEPLTNHSWKGHELCLKHASSNCKGHHAYDLTFFKTVHRHDDGKYSAEHLTNEEVKSAVVPRTGTYKAPYLFEHFTWDHCAKFGYEF